MSLDWMEQALCTQVDADLFFPKRGANPNEARFVCGRCPVRIECLQHAQDLERSSPWNVIGIWGGTTVKERARLRRAA